MEGDGGFPVLAERFDGLAWCVMALIADLECREQIDGRRFCESLRRTAASRRKAAGLEIAAQTIEQLADRLDAARASRRSGARMG